MQGSASPVNCNDDAHESIRKVIEHRSVIFPTQDVTITRREFVETQERLPIGIEHSWRFDRAATDEVPGATAAVGRLRHGSEPTRPR
jgi:hypothetical protein